LDEAKAQSPSVQKNLWNFQGLLQAIPDWNHDKVIRETDSIQKNCKCDYLEELLTAVFIAHTKVLSAIRMSTKQKKLQITIPKIDHFLHRVLSECARSIWSNAFLFVETNSIDKQKNMRQVSALIQDAIQQAIRGLLPVKSILREYLHDDGEEEEKEEVKPEEEAEVEVKGGVKDVTEDGGDAKEAKEGEVKEGEGEVKEGEGEVKEVKEGEGETKEGDAKEAKEGEVKQAKEVKEGEAKEAKEGEVKEVKGETSQPTIYIDTKPSVSFSNGHVMFSENLEENEIKDLPLSGEEGEITITDEILPMDVDEFIE
jgi:hypothetical protein